MWHCVTGLYPWVLYRAGVSVYAVCSFTLQAACKPRAPQAPRNVTEKTLRLGIHECRTLTSQPMKIETALFVLCYNWRLHLQHATQRPQLAASASVKGLLGGAGEEGGSKQNASPHPGQHPHRSKTSLKELLYSTRTTLTSRKLSAGSYRKLNLQLSPLFLPTRSHKRFQPV